MSSKWFCGICGKPMRPENSNSVTEFDIWDRVCNWCFDDVCDFAKQEIGRLKRETTYAEADVTTGHNSLCDICGGVAPTLSRISVGRYGNKIDACKKHARIIGRATKSRFFPKATAKTETHAEDRPRGRSSEPCDARQAGSWNRLRNARERA